MSERTSEAFRKTMAAIVEAAPPAPDLPTTAPTPTRRRWTPARVAATAFAGTLLAGAISYAFLTGPFASDQAPGTSQGEVAAAEGGLEGKADPMSQLALVSVIAGVVIIAARAPMALAPVASSRRIRRMIDSDARIRIAGGIFGAIGLAMAIAANASDHDAAWVILYGGWAWVVVALVLVGNPSFYRDIARSVLRDPWRMRTLGAIGALFGALVVYLGIAVY